MENKIILKEIKVNKNRVDYNFTVEGNWRKYFLDKPFYIEYEENIDEVPKSILVIPFLGDILPMSWVFNATIVVDEVDEAFIHCLEDVKKGYINMYPQIQFLGNFEVKQCVKNIYTPSDISLSLFSGGIDAYSTLISHITENLITTTLWGADIDINDEIEWKQVDKNIKEELKKEHIKNITIKTSFRKIINEKNLDKYIKPKAGDGWWHGFQHGIGIITHTAPINYKYKIKNVYIASSFTKDDHEVCASDPSIDNKIKIANTNVIHDGYEYDRKQKILNIEKYMKKSGKKIYVRVCLTKGAIKNCCACEKCYRTIMEITSLNLNPNDFGFECSNDTYKKIQKDFKNKIILRHTKNWKRIQNTFIENIGIFKNDNRVNWILNFDFDKNNKNIRKELYRYKKGLMRRIKNKK